MAGAGVNLRVRVLYNHLPNVIDGLDRLADDYPERLAKLHIVHHQEEAPVGREVYTDAEGHEHPGWLRDSADAIPLPGGEWLTTVHAFYGVYVNYGTRHMAANPFWERATLRTEREAEPLADAMVRAMLQRARVT
jgi:hypothetical protein